MAASGTARNVPVELTAEAIATRALEIRASAAARIVKRLNPDERWELLANVISPTDDVLRASLAQARRDLEERAA